MEAAAGGWVGGVGDFAAEDDSLAAGGGMEREGGGE
jgi:hypothetical protein